MPTLVLVAGATGMMGTKIARALVARDATVRALVRPGKREEADDLRGLGATPVEGDLTDHDSLLAACDGVGVVVSAVQGLHEVIVDGQANLLRAAEAKGVRRMIPSDYAADLFKLAEGENRNFDLRREFNRRLDASAVRGTSVLNGGFTDMLLQGFAGLDLKAGTFTVWGDGEQPCDFTTTDDTAEYVAAAALDDAAPRVLRFAGDTLTMNQLRGIVERVTGRPLRATTAGSVDDLARKIEQEKRKPADPGDPFPLFQQLQYVHNMVSGRAKLDPLDNARYPDVRPQTVEQFLRANADARNT